MIARSKPSCCINSLLCGLAVILAGFATGYALKDDSSGVALVEKGDSSSSAAIPFLQYNHSSPILREAPASLQQGSGQPTISTTTAGKISSSGGARVTCLGLTLE